MGDMMLHPPPTGNQRGTRDNRQVEPIDRKRQFSFGLGRQRRAWSLKQLWERALA